MKGVLFLCVHNAGRSQMAAGFMREIGAGKVEVFSAGSDPSSELNLVVLTAMAEVGIDISSARPQHWTDGMLNVVDVVVTMGCGDSCPIIPEKKYIDWSITDPAGKDIVEVRQIRDEIKTHVEDLLADLS